MGRGHDREALLARYALDPAVLADVDGRVPLTTVARMWNELPELLDDPDLPLGLLGHTAEADPPLPVLLFLASPTLGDGIRRMVLYERLGYDVAPEPVTELVVDGDRAHVVLHHERSAVDPPTGAVLQTLGALCLMARASTRTDVVPLEVRLRHPLPRDLGPYQALFRCPLVFGADRDRLTLAAADLALPHPGASPTLLAITDRHADQALAALPAGDDPVAAIRQAIRARLPDGTVVLADVAGVLGVSPRTLQRRLADEGTSLRRLVDEERRTLALRHIADARTSLVDLAFFLGFADQTSFTRAFSRWTARSPAEYRRTLAR